VSAASLERFFNLNEGNATGIPGGVKLPGIISDGNGKKVKGKKLKSSFLQEKPA